MDGREDSMGISNQDTKRITYPPFTSSHPELDPDVLSISIYIDHASSAAPVELAVRTFIDNIGASILEAYPPVFGSWSRAMRASFAKAAKSEAGRDAAAMGAHAAAARLVHAQDAAITATMMEHVPKLLESLTPLSNAVLRIGALLVVKHENQVVVHQLTPAQQLDLAREPGLLAKPNEILSALSLRDHDSLMSVIDEAMTKEELVSVENPQLEQRAEQGFGL